MTRKRRYLISAAVIAGCVCLAWAVLAMLLPPQRGVTKANFDRIQAGMMKPEVESMFGQGSMMMPWADPPISALRGADNCICWVDNRDWKNPDRTAYVFFDKNGCVLHTFWHVEQTNVLDKIRRWLHLD